MATWTELKQFLYNNYKIDNDSGDVIRMLFDTGNGRSQFISVHNFDPLVTLFSTCSLSTFLLPPKKRISKGCLILQWRKKRLDRQVKCVLFIWSILIKYVSFLSLSMKLYIHHQMIFFFQDFRISVTLHLFLKHGLSTIKYDSD